MGAGNEKLATKFKHKNPYSKGASGGANAIEVKSIQSCSFQAPFHHSHSSLTQTDLDFLCSYTGACEEEILKIFQKFFVNCPDGKMDRNTFEQVYSELKNEPVEQIHKISEFVFKAFDIDSSGYLSVNEFMVIRLLFCHFEFGQDSIFLYWSSR